jgi:hypothetical protein
MFGRKKLKQQILDTELKYKTALAECMNIMNPDQTKKIGKALLDLEVLTESDKVFVSNLLRQNERPTKEELRIMQGHAWQGRTMFNRKKKK